MNISREIKTGIIGIGGILLFLLGYSYLKSSPLFENNKTLYVVYHHVGGLQPGTAVSINGFTVGKVNDVGFLDANSCRPEYIQSVSIHFFVYSLLSLSFLTTSSNSLIVFKNFIGFF